MESKPLSQTEVESLLDNLCDEFEAELKRSVSPAIGSYFNRAPDDLVDRLCSELLAIYAEINGGQQLEDYVELQIKAGSNHGKRLLTAAEAIKSKLEDTDLTKSHVSQTPKQLKPQVGNYKLLQEIGEGGMGVVWLAQQEQPVRRRVALKLIKPSLGTDEIVARFEAERQAVAMMDHPNIAKLLDAGTSDNGQPYFAMELVKGLPLVDYCDANRLKLRSRIDLFRQICDGILHAHQKGVLHRDLKPTNILVAEYNGQPVPKIIDFGLAKALESSLKLTDKSMFTEFGQVMGSFRYMSPEQAGLDSIDIDTRADIYSLGIILYEMLTGTTPIVSDSFKGLGLLKVLELIRDADSPRPSNRIETTDREALLAIAQRRGTDTTRLRQSVLGDLDWIVGKTLDKDRTRRYSTVAELSEDLRRFMDGDPIMARPPTWRYRLRKFVFKRRGLVASIALASFLLVAGTAFSSWFAWQANKSAKAAIQSEQQAEQKSQQAQDTLSILLESFSATNPNQGGSASVPAVDVLHQAQAKINDSNLDSESLADIYRSLTTAYLGLGDYKTALETAKLAVSKHKALLGESDPRTKEVENDLAVAYKKNGAYQKAIELFQHVRTFHLEREGAEGRDALALSLNLASAYSASGKLDLATELYDETKRVMYRSLSEQDPLRLSLLSDLASHRFSSGDVPGALKTVGARVFIDVQNDVRRRF